MIQKIHDSGVRTETDVQVEPIAGRESLPESLELLDLRGAEAIDALLGIAHDQKAWRGHAASLAADQFRQAHLQPTRILKLIDQQVSARGRDFVAKPLVAGEQAQRAQFEIAEIHRVPGSLGCVVGLHDVFS